MAIAWSRISSKVIAHPPSAHETCRRRCGHCGCPWAHIYRKWPTEDTTSTPMRLLDSAKYVSIPPLAPQSLPRLWRTARRWRTRRSQRPGGFRGYARPGAEWAGPQHLGVAEPYIVPSDSFLPQEGVLIGRDHVVRRGLGIVEKKLAVSLHGWCAWDSRGLEARQTLVRDRSANRWPVHAPVVCCLDGRLLARSCVAQEVFAGEGAAESAAFLRRIRHDIEPAVASLVESVKGVESILARICQGACWFALVRVNHSELRRIPPSSKLVSTRCTTPVRSRTNKASIVPSAPMAPAVKSVGAS